MGAALGNRDVQRLHIRSTVETVDHDAATRWCLDEGYAGMGWGLWDEESGRTWDRYEADIGGANGNVKRLHDIEPGALIWTRERKGVYWLGVITGDWEYRDDELAQRLDLFNLRAADWKCVGTEDVVPGRVVNAFRSRMTLQRIHDPGARAYTNRLYQRLFEGRRAFEAVDSQTIITSLLGPEDHEDLVAVYLQDHLGYLVVSRLRSTPGYEYVLRTREGARAVVSVKSGDTPVDLGLLPSDEVDESFAYAVSETYLGPTHPNLTCITTDQLARFMVERRKVLPERVAAWLTGP